MQKCRFKFSFFLPIIILNSLQKIVFSGFSPAKKTAVLPTNWSLRVKATQEGVVRSPLLLGIITGIPF